MAKATTTTRKRKTAKRPAPKKKSVPKKKPAVKKKSAPKKNSSSTNTPATPSKGNVREIVILGANEHNLQHVDVRIPRDKMVVFTGLSGSGKSSLAFDTIYAEGQRKYVESLSAYARQFLQQLAKPDVEHIEGLCPTVAIGQRSGGSNPRSTVATVTEIYDYMRLFFARVGRPHCWRCGREIASQTVSQMVDSIMSLPPETRFMVLAPVVRGQKGQHNDILRHIRREGYVRVRINGEIHDLKELPELAKTKTHTIEVIVDRLILRDSVQIRLADSLETALKLSTGLVVITHEKKTTSKAGVKWVDLLFSAIYACPDHPDANLEELSPRMFSFNSPYGACGSCDGLGTILEFDEDLIIPDETLSLSGGAIDAWRHGGKRMNIFYSRIIRKFCKHYEVSPAVPIRDFSDKVRKVLLRGDKKANWEGVIPNLDRRWRKTDSEYVKSKLHSFMSEQPCGECNGARLSLPSLAVTVNGLNIHQVTSMNIAESLAYFEGLVLDEERTKIAELILREIRHRLTFLINVGLEYISLNRTAATLSGGEAQRIRLATQVGSGLVGVCYVLDEPTIGLHPRDNQRLIKTLSHLRDIGNTVIVVEHDEDTIRAADEVIDIGPAAGKHGGRIIAQGSVEDICNTPESITGMYLSGKCKIEIPSHRRKLLKQNAIELRGCREHNLKDISVKFPLGGIVCVTGVSGSGKSTLVNQTLLPALKRRIYATRTKPGQFDKVLGSMQIDKVIEIDQSPIGRTPRSNPATYTGVFDQIRQLFSKTREAKIRGYKPGRFSFNVKGGRCEACQGQGMKRIEMHFLPDVFVTCQECRGKRYNRETLEVRYKGKNIADVLAMQIEDAVTFFDSIPKIRQLLRALSDVGLGYIEIGQSSTTLSGGEAQRVKLASELGKTATGHTLYVLDEPTTGLHFADIHNLLNVINRLADAGNSIIIIEHNLDVIKFSDWIIDIGPEGGDAGGYIVAEGPPEQIAKHESSYTGQFLAKHLDQ